MLTYLQFTQFSSGSKYILSGYNEDIGGDLILNSGSLSRLLVDTWLEIHLKSQDIDVDTLNFEGRNAKI